MANYNTPQTSKSRFCPGMRSCWPELSYHSFSLRTSDKMTLFRRICMIAILGIRTVMSVLNIVAYPFGHGVVYTIVTVIIAVLAFFFIAWCLARIGDMYGERRVLGVRLGRIHFDLFLAVVALIHLAVFVGMFFGGGGGVSYGLWIAMWLLLFAAAWITTWEPEPESRSHGIV